MKKRADRAALFAFMATLFGIQKLHRQYIQGILRSEFTNPVAIECTEYGEIRSRVFYCDPQRSDQKGGCEVTHEFIRRVLPKGTSFDHLQQSDINLMMSHINSYTRKKLGNQSAYRLFSFFYGESVLPSLGIYEIPANDINLTPRLLNK